MRIIAGDYKGRRLYTPRDRSIRPTSDKVKEALFSILGEDIIGAYVCDLFSGTGNLGLEALSRGADKCYFADNSGESIKLITDNVEMCRAEEYSVIVKGDFKKCISQIDLAGDKIDIFFLDPPYDKGLWTKAIDAIKESDILAEGGVIVCEHYKEIELPEEISGFTRVKDRAYGKVVLSFYSILCN
ncbi:MAG: 16S rRNA (guanine(966)-N(2))-methyltransferase RsmD [Firmicutes bacterium]|nr:16S rRNA (guanine(966)-N(2))-methyltransferase RsmD [Bacillota bacterium]